MKYPQITRGIEAGSTSGGPAGAPISPASEPTASPSEPVVPTTPADWRQGLSDELRVAPALHDVGDVNSLAQQFVDQQAFMGNALRVPGPDAGSEDVHAFHQRLVDKVPGLMPRPDPTDPDVMSTVYDAMGRPTEAKEYTNPVIEGAPPLSDDVNRAYAESAYKNGLSQNQYQNLMSDFVEAQGREVAGFQAAREIEVAELRQEWGYTYDGRIAAVEGVMTQMGFSAPVIDALKSNGLPKQDLAAFYNIVTALGGEESLALQPSGGSTAITPAEAEMQIQEIMSREEYTHPDFKIRKPWMDKVQVLLKSIPRRSAG